MTAAPSADRTLFTDSLVVALSFPGAQGDLTVPGGNVKRLELRLEPHGFRGQVIFWMPAPAPVNEGQDLHAKVIAPDLLEFELAVSKRHYLEETPDPLACKGIVTRRSFVEVAATDVVGQPVLFRQYTLELADAARALWSQHHPDSVYADATLEKIISEHAPGQVPLILSWPALKAKRRIVCLGLGSDAASFYDFVCWFADQQQGHFSYDYVKKSFCLSGDKPSAAKVAALAADLCAQAVVHLPEAARASVNVLNSHADGTAKTPVKNASAVDPLTRDVLMHTPLAQDTKDREALETRRLGAGQPELELRCQRFPEIHLAPGVAASLDPDQWSRGLHHAGKTLRTLSVHLEAAAVDDAPEHDLGLPFTDYRTRLTYRFECDDDPRPRLPDYRVPRYPLRVEGTVLSTVGDDGDRAYMIYEDEATSRDHYQVLLPLWNATIDVPFRPGFQPGHLYFPAYKGARVMLELGFDWSRIEAFLDWGPNVRVPVTSQGNHILFGRNSTSETSMRNWYVDAKPEFQIKRVHKGDTEVVTVKDGLVTIETYDDSTDDGLGGSTVDLTPDAEVAKASAQGQTDLATSDLDSTVQTLGGQLGGNLDTAASSIDQQASDLQGDVRGHADTASAQLDSIGTDASDASARAKAALSDARRKVKSLFEGE